MRRIVPHACVSSCVFVIVRSAICAAVALIASPAFGQTVAAGAGHMVIAKSDGTVWTVGHNASGQIGDNSTTTRMSPVQVSGLTDIVAVAAGAHHSLAITSTGNLYVWGDNTYGQVGGYDDAVWDDHVPTRIRRRSSH